jgi:hypothetical protein
VPVVTNNSITINLQLKANFWPFGDQAISKISELPSVNTIHEGRLSLICNSILRVTSREGPLPNRLRPHSRRKRSKDFDFLGSALGLNFVYDPPNRLLISLLQASMQSLMNVSISFSDLPGRLRSSCRIRNCRSWTDFAKCPICLSETIPLTSLGCDRPR